MPKGQPNDPTKDVAATAALVAHGNAERSRLPPVACYRAAVAAWRLVYPDHPPAYAAQQAVSVILASKGKLKPPEE